MEGKVALVTGASSGIGRATAIAFARRKVKVAVVDTDMQRGKETVEQIHKMNGEAMFIQADVTKSEGWSSRF